MKIKENSLPEKNIKTLSLYNSHNFVTGFINKSKKSIVYILSGFYFKKIGYSFRHAVNN